MRPDPPHLLSRSPDFENGLQKPDRRPNCQFEERPRPGGLYGEQRQTGPPVDEFERVARLRRLETFFQRSPKPVRKEQTETMGRPKV